MKLLKQHVGHIKLEANDRQSHDQSSGAVICAGEQNKETTGVEHEQYNTVYFIRVEN